MEKVFIIYLIIINVITFFVFGIDKYKAVKNKWRIPEAVLFGLSLLGGSVGGILAMYIFRHKTRKLSFKIGMPLILIAQIVLVFLIKNI